MTLIACTINHKVPFLTADILMSSTEETQVVHLPTNNFNLKPFLPSNNSYSPHSLAQKLYIIGGNVCAIFAGAEYEIRQFLQELKSRSKLLDGLTSEQIKDFLNEYDLPTNFPNSAFFLVSVEHTSPDSIYVGMFNYPQKIAEEDSSNNGGWLSAKSDVFDQVFACGSGRDRFINIVNQIGIFTSRHDKGEIWYALQSNITLIAKLLAIEKATLYTLQTNWGGGFETAFYNGRAFEKISNIAYIVAQGVFDNCGEVGIPFPRLILYYTYEADILRIIALEVKKASKTTIDKKVFITAKKGDFEWNCFDVEPLDQFNLHLDLSKNYSFRTNHVAMGYAIVTPVNGIYNPAYFNVHNELTVTYDHEATIEVILSEEICDSVRKSCKEAFDSNWA